MEAWEAGQDPVTNPLTQINNQVVHEMGGVGDPTQGYYAGIPGKFFAKANHNTKGNSPTFFYRHYGPGI